MLNNINYTAKEMLSITKECKKRAYQKGYRAGKRKGYYEGVLAEIELRNRLTEDKGKEIKYVEE